MKTDTGIYYWAHMLDEAMNAKCQALSEEEGISNNDVYLANMAKSFGDKAWFLKYIPKDVSMIVDFGGGSGEFCEYIRGKLGNEVKCVIIDNNSTFLKGAAAKGLECFASLQELREAKGLELSNALLVLSSVIHEVYSYADEFYDDVGVFWSDIKKCGFRCIAIRDMSYDEHAMKNAPVDAILWVYENILKSPTIAFKGIPFKDITDSFESVWGPICNPVTRKVNTKQLFHFLIKYRYQENWSREVEENYLPVSQEKLAKWLTSFMPYAFKHKESSKLEFYHKCWAKDLKLNTPDNHNYKKQFLNWLMTLNTHIKWFLQRSANKQLGNVDESKAAYL